MAKDCSISAVVITKNEEKNIARCLDSLSGIADEIIVVDSFSDDKTQQICLDRKTRFIQVEWLGYSETKNYGNSLASYPYILSIDADEALSKDLQDELIQMKSKGFNLEAFMMKRLTNYCGKWIYHCGWYPDWKLRLWKKDKGQWMDEIHEKVELSEKTRVGKLNGNILHYSYYSINEHINQMMHFTDLMAKRNHRKRIPLVVFKLLFSPPVKFIKAYIIQGGFLDGFYGLIICTLSGMSTFLKYAKTIQLGRNN